MDLNFNIKVHMPIDNAQQGIVFSKKMIICELW